VNPEEDGEEGLACFEVAVRAEAGEEGVQEGFQVRDGRQ
jgi:hypothetical protein